MSVCGQGTDDSVSEELGVPVRDHYQQKAASKIVRVLTVIAYLLSVSLAAILLSVYYVCVWKPPPPPRNDTVVSARRASAGFHPEHITMLPKSYEDSYEEGRSNITVTTIQPTNASDGTGSTQATEKGSGEASTQPLPDPADLLASDTSNSTSEDTFNITNPVT